RAAAGWYIGMIVSSPFVKDFPWCLLAEYSSPISALMAGVPNAQRILGLISLICDCKYGLQVSISDFLGALLFGGLHLTMFVMNTSDRFSPMDSRSSVRNLPAAPTKGLPCSSSFCPGPSPTNMILASWGPSTGTAFVRLSA